MGAKDAAVKALRTVTRTQPDDRLAQQLLADLVPPSAGGSASSPEGHAQTVSASTPSSSTPPPANLTGMWKATGAGGAAIELNLGQDGHFTWKATTNGSTKSFAGDYAQGSGILTLVGKNAPTIVGHVTGEGSGKFHFKLLGGGPADPGLTFSHAS
jgi:hypothetical protein